MAPQKLTRYFQNASNKVLDILQKEKKRPGAEPLTDHALAGRVGVSSNLIQRVLAHLLGQGLVSRAGGSWQLTRALRKGDYFDLEGGELSQRESIDNYCIKELSSGRFRPGDRISELKLAREANVSTGSVRESLLRLSRFGVIEKNARRQWHVVEWSAPKIDQLTEWRLLVEQHCLNQLLARRPPALIEKLKSLLADHRDLLQNGKPSAEKFARLDEQLHATILAASQNPFLEEAFRTIWFIIQFQFLHHALDPKLVMLGGSQHVKLLKAILAQDRSLANELLSEHMHTAGQTLKQLNAVA